MKNQFLNINLFVIILILVFTSCKKDKIYNEQEYSIIETHDVTTISDTGIVATASFVRKGTAEIIDCGFVWSQTENPTIKSSKISIGAINEDQNFVANINNDLYNDKRYYIRAYAQTDNYVSYGNNISFHSKGGLPPEIFSFSPTEGNYETEVIINGKKFSNNKNNITLLFGIDTIRVDSSTNEKIFFTTPISQYTGDFSISIELNGKKITASDKFQILGPRISAITPNPAKATQEITIEGESFGSEISDIQLTINSIEMEVVSCDDNQIIAHIPANARSGENILALKINNKITFFELIIQSSWFRKNIIGSIGRTEAVGFSIADKGYVGTGYGEGYRNDFWEYTPETDTWKQKANFTGTERASAVGFSIGNKGYIGTGYNSSGNKNDFYEYNPETNTWTQKANFGGTTRHGAVGFSIGNKGYIGTGYDENYDLKKDFWEYNPETDTWTPKANFGGYGRFGAVGFSLGNKGYIGKGNNGNDFWEYNPETNNWIQKTSFTSRLDEAVGFSIGNKGYIGTGSGNSKNDFWEYNTETDTWIQKAYFEGYTRYDAIGFSIGNKGYIGTGNIGNDVYTKDFWEYDPN